MALWRGLSVQSRYGMHIRAATVFCGPLIPGSCSGFGASAAAPAASGGSTSPGRACTPTGTTPPFHGARQKRTLQRLRRVGSGAYILPIKRILGFSRTHLAHNRLSAWSVRRSIPRDGRLPMSSIAACGYFKHACLSKRASLRSLRQ